MPRPQKADFIFKSTVMKSITARLSVIAEVPRSQSSMVSCRTENGSSSLTVMSFGVTRLPPKKLLFRLTMLVPLRILSPCPACPNAQCTSRFRSQARTGRFTVSAVLKSPKAISSRTLHSRPSFHTCSRCFLTVINPIRLFL